MLHPHGLVALLAVAVLLRPSSLRRFALLAAAETVSVALDLPAIGDHTLLAFVTSAAVCAALLAARGNTDGLWERLAPFVRAQAVLLYAAAALAKLNSGFLDPAVSCVAGQLDALGAGADAVAVPAIAATIAVEAALAIGLVAPRTRRAAVLLGTAFHAVLALAGNVPFAALALAYYVAFMAPDLRVPDGLRRRRRLALAGAAVAAWLLLAALEPEGARAVTRALLRVAVVGWAAGFALLALRSRGAAPGVRRLHPAYAVALALLAVNAASPYLGLKTETSFAMYSNLQTEPGFWNHLLVPDAVRVFGAQDELVRVEGSNAPGLERRRRAGALMVRMELERFVRERPGTVATYSDARNPRRRRTVSTATLPPAPPAARIANFYDVRPGARGRC